MVDFQIKELTKKDLDQSHGYLETLSNLAEVGNLSRKRMEEILEKIKLQGFYIFIAITDDEQILGTITLLLEQKFIHNGGIAGHIEDVVTRKSYEGIGVASALIKKAIQIAQESGCYKVILDCENKLIPFYEKFGFQKKENCMKMYFED